MENTIVVILHSLHIVVEAQMEKDIKNVHWYIVQFKNMAEKILKKKLYLQHKLNKMV